MSMSMRVVAASVLVAALAAVACGGSEPPPAEPASLPTSPSSGASYADVWGNAKVSGGTATEVPSPVVAPGSPGASSTSASTSTTAGATAAGTTAGTPPSNVTSPTSSPYPRLPAGPCDACSGTVTPELQTALNKALEATKGCYVRVLTNNPGARASMNVEVKVGRDGTACDAIAHVDQPEWPGLADCVVAAFRKSSFPVPGNSSCVVARVPALFTPSQ